jgi:cytidine deaminase
MRKTLSTLASIATLSLSADLSPEVCAELVQKAQEARTKAHAPYSNYFVGAALLGKSGNVYLGCNVENASYGLCNCAERTAVFKAVAEGEKEFLACAVVTRDGGMPCGACRQVLNEFNPQMIIISADAEGKICLKTTLDQILPYAFGPANLK